MRGDSGFCRPKLLRHLDAWGIDLRRLALQETGLECACTATIRAKLLKIGAAVLRNTAACDCCRHPSTC